MSKKAKTVIVSENQGSTAYDALIESIKHRIANAENANQVRNYSAELKFFSDVNGRIVVEKCESLGIDVLKLANKVRILKHENKNEYLAIYALQKVRKTMYAVANNVKRFVDSYTNAVLTNLMNLQELNTKDARMSMCKAIEYNELEEVKNIVRTMNCNESTASTQVSSTRMMLDALSIAVVHKGAKNDTIVFNDSAATKVITTFYAK